MNLPIQILKSFATMANHRPCECGQGLFRDFHWPGNEELVVRRHCATNDADFIGFNASL